MTMDEIWLTEAARSALARLPRAQAQAVNRAIREIPSKPGRRLRIPGAPPAEPFLAAVPENREAPVVVYRRSTPEEDGDWLVVSLMNRGDYYTACRAEEALAAAPPAVRESVEAVVAATVATVQVVAHPGTASSTPPPDGGSASTFSPAEPGKNP